ncbi:hypothetical protein LEP1GSC100_4663, partial [Leptospira interrogans serovar Bataviae str. UI 08561]
VDEVSIKKRECIFNNKVLDSQSLQWLNNLHFENEILHETFNDYYSRVRVQEENLKSDGSKDSRDREK